MTSTPLPEQGGFNERLDEILWAVANHYDPDTTDPYPQMTVPQARQALLDWRDKAEKRAELVGIKKYLKQCRMLRMEPTTNGMGMYIKQEEMRIKALNQPEGEK